MLGLPRSTPCHPGPAIVTPVPGWQPWLKKMQPARPRQPALMPSAAAPRLALVAALSLSLLLSRPPSLSRRPFLQQASARPLDMSLLAAVCALLDPPIEGNILDGELWSPIEVVGWRSEAAEDASKGAASVPSVVHLERSVPSVQRRRTIESHHGRRVMSMQNQERLFRIFGCLAYRRM